MWFWGGRGVIGKKQTSHQPKKKSQPSKLPKPNEPGNFMIWGNEKLQDDTRKSQYTTDNEQSPTHPKSRCSRKEHLELEKKQKFDIFLTLYNMLTH